MSSRSVGSNRYSYLCWYCIENISSLVASVISNVYSRYVIMCAAEITEILSTASIFSRVVYLCDALLTYWVYKRRYFMSRDTFQYTFYL